MTDAIVYALYVAASWGWWIPSVALFIAAVWFLARFRRHIQLLNLLAGAIALAVFSQSARLPGEVIRILGRPATGAIVEFERPDRPQYVVVLDGQDGSVHRILFDLRKGDTNWQPGFANPVIPFRLNERFDARYLGSSPEHFVFLLDDDSPFALRLKGSRPHS
jgi:hypothetical protein